MTKRERAEIEHNSSRLRKTIVVERTRINPFLTPRLQVTTLSQTPKPALDKIKCAHCNHEIISQNKQRQCEICSGLFCISCSRTGRRVDSKGQSKRFFVSIARLIEAALIKKMQLKHIKSVAIPSSSNKDTQKRINAICYSPNGQKIAVSTGSDNLIHLLDETGERKDKFPTKSSTDSKNSEYTTTGLAFSPDSTRLAVSLSDGGVFVYKLGNEWGEKKSICNKFIEGNSVSVTCLIWPRQPSNSIVYGSSDGKVYLGNLKSNKSSLIFETGEYTLCLAPSFDGSAFASGHADGSINRYSFASNAPDSHQGRFVMHTCAPTVLLWSKSGIMTVGSDKRVVFYAENGSKVQQISYDKDESQSIFSVGQTSTTGDHIMLGSFDRIHFLKWNVQLGEWKEDTVKQIKNLCLPSCMSWGPTGQFVLATTFGSVEMFECFTRRTRYNGKYDIVQVGGNLVSVSKVASNYSIRLKAGLSCDFSDVFILKDRYVVGITTTSILLLDMESQKQSEVQWARSTENLKFFFADSGMAFIQSQGEVAIVTIGTNEIIGVLRMEKFRLNKVSLLIREREPSYAAFLSSRTELQVTCLNDGRVLSTITLNHPSVSVQLSRKGDHVLCRDTQRKLHLIDVESRQSKILASNVSFAQWTPFSDVIVAQSQSQLLVWFNLNTLETFSSYDIKGDVIAIEKNGAKSRVILEEDGNRTFFDLDNSYAELEAYLKDRDFVRAIISLEQLDQTKSLSLWKRLAEKALIEGKLYVAERAHVGCGDVVTARYLRDIINLAEELKRINPMLDNPFEHHLVKAKLLVMDKKYKVAEELLLEHGRVQEAMDMYQALHKWNDSIRVAELVQHPDLTTLKINYFNWLVESGQYDLAAAVKERENDYVTAIDLFLRGGMARRAAELVDKHRLKLNPDLLKKIASSLKTAGFYDKTGEILKSMSLISEAYETYREGKEFKFAVELARVHYPSDVVTLEELWAESLLSKRQFEASVNHFLEAGQAEKALDVAIMSKQWKKVAAILESIPESSIPAKFLLLMGDHYKVSGDLDKAEQYYKKANSPEKVIEMLISYNKWQKALQNAYATMDTDAVEDLFFNRAKQLESKGQFKDAESIYLMLENPDEAIAMYRSNRLNDDILRLVKIYHKDQLKDTLMFFAEESEKDDNFVEAERYYLEAGEWKSAVSMFSTKNQFEEAHKVAWSYGGDHAAKQVAYIWAKSLGGEAAYKLLSKHDMFIYAVDLAFENDQESFALEIAEFAHKQQQDQVYARMARSLERQGLIKDAKSWFLKAGLFREAISMLTKAGEWSDALNLAERHLPDSTHDILISRAKACFNSNDFTTAETCLLRAQRPEVMLEMYQKAGMWNEAMSFASEHLPSKLADIQVASETERRPLNSSNPSYQHVPRTNNSLEVAKVFEEQQEYCKAVETYLEAVDLDPSVRENAWSRALEITVKFLPSKLEEVTNEIAERYLKLGQYITAAELFIRTNNIQRATDSYIAANKWEEALRISERFPHIRKYVETTYASHLRSKGATDALASIDLSGALDIYAKRGDWKQCLEKAKSGGNMNLLNKYLSLYVDQMIILGKYAMLVETLVSHGLPKPIRDGLLENITFSIIGMDDFTLMNDLKQVLFNAISEHGSATFCHDALKLMILRNKISSATGLANLAAKISLALLRYASDIPADRLFYQAGRYYNQTNNDQMTFVLWNFYLDLADSIDDQLKQASIEGTEFESSDLPRLLKLSEKNIEELKREEVRDYVLAKSLEIKFDKSVIMRPCVSCNAPILLSTLKCPYCSHLEDECVITGLPVLDKNPAKCRNCNRAANRDDWNAVIISEKICPNCCSPATPQLS